MTAEKQVAKKLINLFIDYQNELTYANLNEHNQYSGWVQNLKIQTIDNNEISLDLKEEEDLFLLFVLAIVWSRSGHWENSVYFVAYLKIFDKSSPSFWNINNNIRIELNYRYQAAHEIVEKINNHNTRRKVSFREDIYDSIALLANEWPNIKNTLNESYNSANFILFMTFIRSIKGLGVKQRQILIKIPLILRELRCQNIYPNIPGELCCVPDKRVLDASKKLGIKLQSPYYKSSENLNSLLDASSKIYYLFGDLYDLPLFAYEDLKGYFDR